MTSNRHALLRRLPAADILALLALLVAGLLLTAWAYRAPRSTAVRIDAPPVLLSLRDFHEVERFADRPGNYRWSRASAIAQLPTPGGPAVLRAVLAGGPGRTVQVRVSAGNATAVFAVLPEPRTYLLALPATEGERVAVTFEAQPIAQGNRELGVVVGDMAIAGGGGAPLRVPLALIVATAGLYALFRRSGLRPLPAAGAVLLVQILAVLWQAAGLWRFGLFGPLLLLIGGGSLVAVAA
ncbi:MAG TPA: hypothetical protein VFS21_05580, partial [Roseiflexaceae bacterium]|nr:hypothetical protein [Roseiflexaceae bacterium]